MDNQRLQGDVRQRVTSDPDWLPYAAAEIAAEHLGLAEGERWAIDAWEGLPMLRVMREHMPFDKLQGGWPAICRVKATSMLDSLIRAGEALEARIDREVDRRIQSARHRRIDPT